jgi:hypothetical protein
MLYVTQSELMAYCRVDDNASIAILEPIATSAEDYLIAAGVCPTPDNYNQVKLAVCAITLHWFDNPTGGELPVGLRQLVNQLKLASMDAAEEV